MLGERIFSSAQPFPLKLQRIRLKVLPLVYSNVVQRPHHEIGRQFTNSVKYFTGCREGAIKSKYRMEFIYMCLSPMLCYLLLIN